MGYNTNICMQWLIIVKSSNPRERNSWHTCYYISLQMTSAETAFHLVPPQTQPFNVHMVWWKIQTKYLHLLRTSVTISSLSGRRCVKVSHDEISWAYNLKKRGVHANTITEKASCHRFQSWNSNYEKYVLRCLDRYWNVSSCINNLDCLWFMLFISQI